MFLNNKSLLTSTFKLQQNVRSEIQRVSVTLITEDISQSDTNIIIKCCYFTFYNYLCNQCLSPLMLWVRISIRARCTTLCNKVCQWLATGRWFSPGTPVSSTNKTDCHDITEILLKMALNTIKQTNGGQVVKDDDFWHKPNTTDVVLCLNPEIPH